MQTGVGGVVPKCISIKIPTVTIQDDICKSRKIYPFSDIKDVGFWMCFFVMFGKMSVFHNQQAIYILNSVDLNEETQNTKRNTLYH